LPTTGFAGLWKSGLPETPLLLATAAFAVVFLNAIIGDSPDDRTGGRLWRVTEAVLLFAVLPLGLLALVSMGLRVGQYGWTPERLWGVIACLIAIAYGAAAWLAGIRGRRAFDVPLRESQKWLAVGLCALALFLALPILDFGSISTRSQLARLEAGKVKADQFDWAALAFDFGPAGREALDRMARSGPADRRAAADAALKAENRYRITEEVIVAGPAPTELTVVPRDAAVPNDLRAQLLGGSGVKEPFCSRGGACRVYPQPGGRTFVVFLDGCANLPPAKQDDPTAKCDRSPAVFEMRNGKWVDVLPSFFPEPRAPFTRKADAAGSLRQEREALERGDVRLVPVTRRQLVIGGKRIAGEFE
jgi:hypothetical protein